MKKIYVLLLVTAGVVLSASAQPFEKGDKLLGGSIFFSNLNPSGNNNSYITASIAPSFGVFKKPNRLLGISANFGFTSPLNGSQRSYGIVVFKQYWNNLGKNFYFIMQGGIGATYDRNTAYKTDSSGIYKDLNRFYLFTFSINPGIAYRINHRLIADAFLSNFVTISDRYFVYKLTRSGNQLIHNTSNTVSFNSSLNGLNLSNIQVGFRYIL